MSSILDALKKADEGRPEDDKSVNLNEEIDADAEKDIIVPEEEPKKVTVHLTPRVMIVSLIAAVIVVGYRKQDTNGCAEPASA